MKNYLLPSIKLTAVLIVLVSVLYPLLIAAVAKMAPGGGDGVKVERNGNVVGMQTWVRNLRPTNILIHALQLWITMPPVPVALIKVPAILIT
ncbi:potassium-transporting ATPase subunit C [Chitinophaga sedimenti]|nr:potassium-transporting ATPase subunit C [Chitinophaga sedimenti]MCK7558474.1 potassium-transporting ATPase subunit C [Chitinophaga sedimenti]